MHTRNPVACPSIALTIRNDTSEPMVLRDSALPEGRWILPPPPSLRPGEAATVAASTGDDLGIGIRLTYSLPGGARAIFLAQTYRYGDSSVDGTRIEPDEGYVVHTQIDRRFPHMCAHYSVSLPDPT
ncbi:hypothetical protein QYS60_02750 [Rhodococcus sp. GXMU-t2271]|uniref:hypothetical protein n=1 Tax=Rhodococcus sp. GXMU-t2271 TaxID=3059079 RepID=UPI003529E8E0